MELTTVWFVLIAVLWIGYFVLEGFDFGVGMLVPVLGRDDRERRVEDPRGGRTPLRLRPRHHPCSTAQLAAAPADADHLAGRLEHVARARRPEEAHLRVAGQQALVAVHDDRDLGGDVAEQAKRVGAVDEGAAVVGVRVRHVPAMGDGEAQTVVGLGHAGISFNGTSAWMR